MDMMHLRDLLEVASFVVTVLGLPFGIWVFIKQERAERENQGRGRQ